MRDLVNMADTSPPRAVQSAETAADRLPVDAVAMIELLYFAYRDFTAESDRLLAEFDFGRAHHRVLHFVNRQPGLRVVDLLDILNITKQSLARVLRQLVEEGFIEQRASASDRRERLLFTTPAGARLAERLLATQIERIGEAARLASGSGPLAVEQFLTGMIDRRDRGRVSNWVGSTHGRVTVLATHSEKTKKGPRHE